MSHESVRLAVIVGSGRKGRTGTVVARWFVGQVEQRGDTELDVIDLADFVLPGEPTENPPSETARVLRDLSRRLAWADAFVTVTPEYNHSFPASLKAMIDWHDTEWQAKPVAFVSYGGMSGGLRAVEQLRQVFPELHAMTIRETVSFHSVWTQFDRDGRPKDSTGCNAAAKTMLDQLTWWATALRDARRKSPYRTSGRRLTYPP